MVLTEEKSERDQLIDHINQLTTDPSQPEAIEARTALAKSVGDLCDTETSLDTENTKLDKLEEDTQAQITQLITIENKLRDALDKAKIEQQKAWDDKDVLYWNNLLSEIENELNSINQTKKDLIGLQQTVQAERKKISKEITEVKAESWDIKNECFNANTMQQTSGVSRKKSLNERAEECTAKMGEIISAIGSCFSRLSTVLSGLISKVRTHEERSENLVSGVSSYINKAPSMVVLPQSTPPEDPGYSNKI